jgi:excisionase family DNA binding protein
MQGSIEQIQKTSIQPQLLDRNEAADFINISTVTLDRAVKSKKVACVRIGRRVLFKPDALNEFIERNSIAAKK